MQNMSEQLILIGTHGDFVHAVFFDTERRTLRQAEPIPTPLNPSWLEQHPSRPEIVYVNSHAECKIFACQVDPKTGQLKRLAEAGTGGQLPAHYTLHPNESTGIIFTHYGSGHVTSIPLSNGLLASDKPSAADTWVGPDIQITDRTHERQTSPRAHQAYVLPDGDVLIPDFGSDKVWRLRHDKSGWQVKGSIDFDLADGPRHCLLHPDGKHLYTITELSNQIVIHDVNTGSLISRHSILPPDDEKHSHLLTASELILLPPIDSGPMLLVTSNRDSPNPAGDALALFAVSPTDGSQIKFTEHVFSGGKHLRGVSADPSGRFVAVTSRNTDELYIYERKGDGTRLEEVARTGGMEKVICPIWIKE